VFGPRQDPASPYAAVIPLFIQHAIAGTTATIYGDGRQTRDFTYVDDVVDANLRALRSDVTGVAMNISLGKGESLLELVDAISVLSSRPLKAVFAAQRAGEIRHSLGDISLAASTIGYQPKVSLRDGLAMVLSSG
jgi:nucleoside-diphosphate-sugar epimerase